MRIALETLATSAELRYHPSLHFLQLLSALDVAWTASALGFGVTLLSSSRRTGFVAAIVLDDAGGWLVSGQDLLTLVIPFDIAAAAVAVGALVARSRRQAIVNSGAT